MDMYSRAGRPRFAATMNENKGGPWGPSGGGGGGGGRRRRRRAAQPLGPAAAASGGRPAGTPNIASLDDLLKRSRARFGGGFPLGRTAGPTGSTGSASCLLLWLVFTSFHAIGPQEQGVVTTFGRYSRTLGPGVDCTLPSPIERVEKVDVEQIQSIDIGSSRPQRRESDADRRPEPHRSRLFGALEHPRSAALSVPASAQPDDDDPAKSPKARCAR